METKEVMEVLRSIERGEIRVNPIDDPDNWNNVSYKLSNGLTLIVFVDAGYFDYVEAILDEKENRVFEWGMSDYVDDYRPNQKIEKEVYKIDKNRSYTAEKNVKVEYFDKCEENSTPANITCLCCHETKGCGDWEKTISTMINEVDEFSIKHYDCDPVFGPQIKLVYV